MTEQGWLDRAVRELDATIRAALIAPNEAVTLVSATHAIATALNRIADALEALRPTGGLMHPGNAEVARRFAAREDEPVDEPAHLFGACRAGHHADCQHVQRLGDGTREWCSCACHRREDTP
jgi:hypothetical protein